MDHLKNLLFKSDNYFISLTNNFFKNKKGIIFLLFHSVFKNLNELNHNHIDSQWGFTLSEYKYIFEQFLNSGYEFISHNQLLDLDNLNEQKKYIYLHFDDGYYNNHNILELLEEYKIYAHFYVVTNNILNNKKFWWDFLFNKAFTLNKKNELISETRYLQNKNFNYIENYITEKYGKKSLDPLSDIDRPFSPNELKLFNSNKYVCIGNHTVDHSYLSYLSNEEAENKIVCAEKDLKNLLGYSEKSLSFPGSKSNAAHYKILKTLNFHYALSNKFKIYDNFDTFHREKYNLGRYCFVRSKKIDWQIKICMTKFSLYHFLSKIL